MVSENDTPPVIERATEANPTSSPPSAPIQVTMSTNSIKNRALQLSKRTHHHKTRNNTSGAVPTICRTIPKSTNTPPPIIWHLPPPKSKPWQSQRIQHLLSSSIQHQSNKSSSLNCPVGREVQQSSAKMSSTLSNQMYIDAKNDCWVPTSIMPIDEQENAIHDLKHLCSPVVHLDTDETITRYKKLQKNPVKREEWKTLVGPKIWNACADRWEHRNKSHEHSLCPRSCRDQKY